MSRAVDGTTRAVGLGDAVGDSPDSGSGYAATMTFELPDLDRPFDHENGFYLSCDVSRIAKFAAHLELFKRTVELPGAIVECGVFKGASLARFATFRQLFGGVHSKPIIAFDVFGPFPESTYSDDADARSTFVAEAGSESISVSDMERVLQHKQIRDNIELVAGDLTRIEAISQIAM